MEGLVSIIIPVFNSEKFLSACLQSILNQTYTNLEIILINDGSTDNSLIICKEYEHKYSRIKLLNQENKGVSTARNVGIEAASGEYLVFIDSDDFLEETMIEVLYNNVKNTTFDMVICGYVVHDTKQSLNMAENIILNKTNKIQNLEVADIALDYWSNYDKGIINPLWNKIYKSSIINNNELRFPTNIPMGEDGYFNLLYLMHSKKIKIIDHSLYHYISYSNQSSKKVYGNYFDIMMQNFEIIEAFIKKYDGFSNLENKKRHYHEIFKVIKNSIIHVTRSKEETLETKQLIIEKFFMNDRVRKTIDKVKVISFKDKVLLYLLNKRYIKNILIQTKIMLILKGL